MFFSDFIYSLTVKSWSNYACWTLILRLYDLQLFFFCKEGKTVPFMQSAVKVIYYFFSKNLSKIVML